MCSAPNLDATTFNPAEVHHQDYHYKNPLRFWFHHFNCGRDARVRAVWGEDAHSGIPQN